MAIVQGGLEHFYKSAARSGLGRASKSRCVTNLIIFISKNGKKNHEKSQNFHFFFLIFWKKEMEKEHHEWDGQVKWKIWTLQMSIMCTLFAIN